MNTHLDVNYSLFKSEGDSDLALEAAKAKQKVCEAEKHLANCILEHQSILLDLWCHRVDVANCHLLNADLNVGRMHMERKSGIAAFAHSDSGLMSQKVLPEVHRDSRGLIKSGFGVAHTKDASRSYLNYISASLGYPGPWSSAKFCHPFHVPCPFHLSYEVRMESSESANPLSMPVSVQPGVYAFVGTSILLSGLPHPAKFGTLTKQPKHRCLTLYDLIFYWRGRVVREKQDLIPQGEIEEGDLECTGPNVTYWSNYSRIFLDRESIQARIPDAL
ncbi:hypothetical protein F4604DRAFT_1686264 [Suillus subluteus]|nr:hypothetical protein F4604DRAFT_1686264 [Suillus subluteus]